MDDFVTIARALGDEARARALMALATGELCVCQIIDLLGLAPSTVSKHMSILHAAGLVERRKQGKWHYYRLAGKDAPPVVRQALRWATQSLAGETVIVKDAGALCCVREKDLVEVTSCYRS